MNFELENKIIIVSGAANGIGSCVFHELLKERAFPIEIDLETFSNSELSKRFHDFNWREGQDFEYITIDASKMRTMRQALDGFQYLGGLVNNAGLLGNDIVHGGRSIKSLDKMINAHAKTAFVLTQLAYPKMVNGGSIVNIGSIETIMAAPDVVLYTTAKGALEGMTVAYATTLGPNNIRVNMISPGNVNTEKNKAQYQDPETEETIRRFETRTPLRRSIEPEEVAKSVLFLLSNVSSGFTGTNQILDAGYTKALWDPGWTDI